MPSTQTRNKPGAFFLSGVVARALFSSLAENKKTEHKKHLAFVLRM
jgi:hypothetical protein